MSLALDEEAHVRRDVPVPGIEVVIAKVVIVELLTITCPLFLPLFPLVPPFPPLFPLVEIKGNLKNLKEIKGN